jgi:Gluconate 2-dehydrogenase subunit 3
MTQQVSRRTLLSWVKRSTFAYTALGATGIVATIRLTGYDYDETRAKSLRVLRPWQMVVLDHVALRMCAPDDLTDSPPSPLDVQVTEFIDQSLSAMHWTQQRDVKALIGVVEHVWPLIASHRKRFSSLDASAQDAVLSQIEQSSLSLMRGAFHALKALVMMGYYRDPRTWGVLHYDGPLVQRPNEGWVQASRLKK